MRRQTPALALFVILACFTPTAGVQAQDKDNFPDRRAIILPTAPMIELSGFSFHNAYASGGTRFHQDLKWKNVGTQPVVAFQVVILKYDAFGERMIGTRWDIEGRNSADWTPLGPGEADGDGTRSYGSEAVHTAIAYVRKVRLADGTVWQASDADLVAGLRRAAPDIKDLGSVKPDPKPASAASLGSTG